ncbi:MAG: hypothetical protein VX278_22335, partial [Myxococcota bacterium]|nr:hypothetical protein [Myxococcota bacterium]
MWDRVVIIPAAYESELLPGCIESLAQHNQNAILILVLNGKENARPEVHKDNRTTFQWLVSNPHQKIASDRWMIRFQNLDILLLDRFSEGRRLGAKQG